MSEQDKKNSDSSLDINSLLENVVATHDQKIEVLRKQPEWKLVREAYEQIDRAEKSANPPATKN